MSAWSGANGEEQFQQVWSALCILSERVQINQETASKEFFLVARFNKVTTHIDGLISGFDTDLLPHDFWESSNSKVTEVLNVLGNFLETRRFDLIVQANKGLDIFLSRVLVYSSVSRYEKDGLGITAKNYSEQLEKYLKSFQSVADISRGSTEAARKQAENINNVLENILHAARGVKSDLETQKKEGGEINLQLDKIFKDSLEKNQKIAQLSRDLIMGPDSLSSKFTSNFSEIAGVNKRMKEMLLAAEGRNQDLISLHDRINGDPDNAEPEKRGLSAQLDYQISRMKSVELDQKKRHEALFLKIESLLPGATSAGLATAYKSLKDNFTAPVKNFTVAFYISLSILFFCALILVVDNFTLMPFSLKFIEASGWDEMLRKLLLRAPLVGPVIWLAIYSGTRRNQYERLQQEYAHKEALAASYESYKKQLIDLNADSEELQKKLISRAIDAMSYNASKTLDRDHSEKFPVMQLLNRLSLDEVRKLIELVRPVKN